MMKQSVEVRDNIDTYLEKHNNKELLRFITCGNVDDGKSTLIGRLLHDSKMVYEDQLSALKNDSARYGTTGDDIDLALLVDGLQAEREQGITIDVAYRYFSTDKRKYIIADTPGHEQFTRNMATGASTADIAIILIDARRGVKTQTRRHSFIASLLGIQHLIVAVNKMDLVDFDETIYNEICEEYKNFSNELKVRKISYIPVSALHGENVVTVGQAMQWYKGDSLIGLLDNYKIESDDVPTFLRFPVQYVNRPNADFRGYCGTLALGHVCEGDNVMILPSKIKTRIKSIITYEGTQKEAYQGQSVTLTLEDQLDVSRGDMIVSPQSMPIISDQLRVTLIWLNEQMLAVGSRFVIKQATRMINGTISKIEYKVNVNTLQQEQTDTLSLNEIGVCQLSLEEEVAFDPYEKVRTTGSLILIDKASNATVGAGLIIGCREDKQTLDDQQSAFDAELKALIGKYFGKIK